MFDVGAIYRSVAHDSRTYRDTIEVKNMIRTLALSARITAPLKYVRPYLSAAAGGMYLGTERMVERCCDENGDRENTLDAIQLARIVPMASAKVGLAIDLWRMRGRTPSTVALDLGVEDNFGGRARYQVGGDGELRQTRTNYRVYSLGISLRNR
jgi:hypothetical protein